MKDASVNITRRTTLRWLGAVVSAASASACGRSGEGAVEESALRAALGEAAAPSGVGYGSDPDLVEPKLTWPLTMTEQQLKFAEALADMIIPEDEVSPSAGSVGTQHFIDEWVSAPYSGQRADRELFFESFTQIEQESLDRFGQSFADITDGQRAEIIDRFAYEDSVSDGYGELARFFARYRWLTMSAFYASDEGMADIGYLGNRPMLGDYPGPTPEALAHLNAVLADLNLPQIVTSTD
jgi:hypothetical protein